MTKRGARQREIFLASETRLPLDRGRPRVAGIECSWEGPLVCPWHKGTISYVYEKTIQLSCCCFGGDPAGSGWLSSPGRGRLGEQGAPPGRVARSTGSGGVPQV